MASTTLPLSTPISLSMPISINQFTDLKERSPISKMHCIYENEAKEKFWIKSEILDYSFVAETFIRVREMDAGIVSWHLAFKFLQLCGLETPKTFLIENPYIHSSSEKFSCSYRCASTVYYCNALAPADTLGNTNLIKARPPHTADNYILQIAFAKSVNLYTLDELLEIKESEPFSKQIEKRRAVLVQQMIHGKPIKGLFENLVADAFLFDFEASDLRFNHFGLMDKGDYYQFVIIDVGNKLIARPISDNEIVLTLSQFVEKIELAWDIVGAFTHIPADKKLGIVQRMASLTDEQIEKTFVQVYQNLAELTHTHIKKNYPIMRNLGLNIVSSLKARRNQFDILLERDAKAVINELSHVDKTAFSVEAMAVMVAAKKERRALKGNIFNCLVLDRNAKPDELSIFLTHLSTNISLYNKARFQVAYQLFNHWSVLDIRVLDHNIECFLLDAANVLPKVLNTILLLHKILPQAIIRYCGGSIQHDRVNCATFALDQAFRLAKLPNLHEDIRELKPTSALYHGMFNDVYHSYGEYLQGIAEYQSQLMILGLENIALIAPIIQYISIADLPCHFGPLLRCMQSLPALETLCSKKPLLGNDSELLQKYVLERISKEEKTDEGTKPINSLIDLKRRSIKRKTQEFLVISTEKYSDIVSVRHRFFTEAKNESSVREEKSAVSATPVKKI